MAINPTDIQPGMEVIAIDGEQIGKVIGIQAPVEGGSGGTGSMRAGDLAGKPTATGSAGQGPMPGGATQDKARGDTTAVGDVAQRGDVHTTLGQEGITPGAGGLDAVRGYGTPPNEDQTPPGRPMTGADLEALRGEAAGTTGGGALDEEMPLPRPGAILVEDDGVLGVDARRLHLPFSAVLDIVPGRRITIDCTRDDAALRYGHGPSLDIDENAKFTPF